MSQPILIGISYSPWTARSRWVLDHHRISYRYREHLLLLGMPELRWRTRQWLSDQLTVPALCTDEGSYLDSWRIAQHADEIGSGRRLIPFDAVAVVERFHAWSEEATSAARALVTLRTPRDPEARSEALLPIAPRFAHGALGWVVGLGASYVAREFGIDVAQGEAPWIATIRDCCKRFRDALGQSGGRYLLGSEIGFSYADILLATTLQGVKPVEHPTLRLRAATRRIWTTPELVDEFADLIAWRDVVYTQHRSAQ